MRKTALSVSMMILCLGLIASTMPPAAFAADGEGELPTTGFLGTFVQDFEAVNKKLLSLAEAIPADKFGWRPTDKVRTVSEVLIHVATTNYFLASSFGLEPPEGVREWETKVTSKDEVLKTLRASIERVHEAVRKNTAADLDEEVALFFGGNRSRRSVFFLFSGHSHEHLGQSIAYARSLGIAPPWSRG